MYRKSYVLFIIFLMVFAFTGSKCGPKPVKPVITTPIEQPLTPPTTDEPKIRPEYGEFTSIPEMQNVLFGYDRFDVSKEAGDILKANAAYLKEHPELEVEVEGNCCECGTNEYNLALGQKR